MLKIAVVGKDVSQSQSPAMHTFILNKMGVACDYSAISIPPAEFSSRAKALLSEYDALNVTIPFKADVIPFLDKIVGDAQTFGAVNTILTDTLTGYNTDGLGFMLMLENAGVKVEGKSVLVLGVGGAGRSCIKKLMEHGAQVYAYERDGERLAAAYRDFGGFTPLSQVPMRAFDIVMNCTGIGMHDTVGKTPSITLEDGTQQPVGKKLLSLCTTAVDLIYVPAQSEFLRIAEELGKKTVNGASMLFYQAYYGDCIYSGRTPSAEEAKQFYVEYLKRETT